MATLSKITKGFYTDGEKIFSKECGSICFWEKHFDGNNCFLKMGNAPVIYTGDKNITVKPVKKGMIFQNGEITVVDKNTIEITVVDLINAKYDNLGHVVSFDGFKELKRKYFNKGVCVMYEEYLVELKSDGKVVGYQDVLAPNRKRAREIISERTTGIRVGKSFKLNEDVYFERDKNTYKPVNIEFLK